MGLHSFELLDDCKNNAFIEKIYAYKSVVVKCIIPKGSKYYKGKFNNYFTVYSSYASDKIKYVEELFEIE